jgi:hypothetical protein
VFDLPGNLFPIKPLRRVLQAVSQDGNNHLPGSVFLGQCSEAEAKVVDGLADSVEQRGASLRLVSIVGERHNFLHRN